ncbi:unnamed protein product [Mytilus coruscus]|uniref:Reverse transcriptase domain-containing protein n=1 Tax=Mytilus coruscus TaxID=42192 RepID=A0A6J8E050_MYTCO|nr:unnamed protein product [Mytilus coruscus]
MTQRAYIDLDARAQEVLALNQLYKSSTSEVKYQCTNHGCRSVAGAVEVELYLDDREKTVFPTSQRLFQFTVTSFSLATSPVVFERLMEDVLRGLQWEECLLYIDYIIVPGATFEEELPRMSSVISSKCLMSPETKGGPEKPRLLKALGVQNSMSLVCGQLKKLWSEVRTDKTL